MHTRGLARLLVSLALLPAAAQAQDSAAPPMAMGGRMVRGTVLAVAADRLTLKTEAGEVYQVAVSPNTQIRKGRDTARLADLHAGDGVGAMGEIEPGNHTIHALFLAVIDAEQVKKLREEMGKSYIAGKVTAIDETRLTVLRSDNVSQTIEVDEDTAFRKGGRGMSGGGGMMIFRGGEGGGPGGGGRPGGPRVATTDEALTLADIKVGDTVVGPGTLKHGMFVPTELGVLKPGQGGGPRRQPGNASGPAASVPGK